jgi:hypothetical protein
MILKKPSSRIFLVNLFADFILSKINQEESTIIKIVDCINFYIIKGKTTSKEVLNIPTLLDEFITKYSKELNGIKLSHTIDLIEYDTKLTEKENYQFIYYNSSNCSYHHTQIDSYIKKESSYNYNLITTEISEDSMVFESEFPHGYSLDQGRAMYYYGKHIFYSIPPNYPVNSLLFNMSKNKTEEGEIIFSVQNISSNKEDNTLTSAILDVFDFDLQPLKNEMKKVDWSFELLNPLEEYDFIKKINKELVII